MQADKVVGSDAERRCLAALRQATAGDDGPIERHSVRVFSIMEMMARVAGVAIDREVALCAALLHDIGLYPVASTPRRFYLYDGKRYAAQVLAPFNWSRSRITRCLDAIELHHRLRSQWKKGPEVELLRLADLVDSSRGLVHFGLPKQEISRLFRSVRRDGLYRELARLSFRAVPCLSRALPAMVINLRRPKVATPKQGS